MLGLWPWQKQRSLLQERASNRFPSPGNFLPNQLGNYGPSLKIVKHGNNIPRPKFYSICIPLSPPPKCHTLYLMFLAYGLFWQFLIFYFYLNKWNKWKNNRDREEEKKKSVRLFSSSAQSCQCHRKKYILKYILKILSAHFQIHIKETD